jgi:predicted metalloprotease with PDZ domain
MGATPDSSITMSWFTEGFTTYYQDLLLLRAGMREFPDYVQRINENLRKYWFSPARNATNQEVIERHHIDSATDDIPYTRGAITALWLDWKIRETTHGKASLDDLMFDLVRQVRKRKPALTADRVFGAARKYIDADAIEQLRAYVELGKTIEVPTAALGPCATVELDDIPPFELGIDRDALVSRRVVSGVKPGSAAYQAGLRDGQQVIGTSIYMNDVSKPVKLTIRTEVGAKTIQYYPRGTSSSPVPQYHLSAAALANPDQCTQGIRTGRRVQ